MNANAFLAQAIRHPLHTGAIAPSSKRLTDLMINSAQLDKANRVVELGPGTGVFTRRILQALAGRGEYLGVERNAVFADLLRQRFLGIDLFEGSAEHLNLELQQRGMGQCDRIISGLPWMAFESALQDRILSAIADSLEEDGLFLTFAYRPFSQLPRGRRFRAKLSDHFESVEQTGVVINVPPASVYVCSGVKCTTKACVS